MSDIPQYRPQVDPSQPRGVSPIQLLAGFHPPDTSVAGAISGGITDVANHVTDLALKAQAADQAEEVARARASYFSSMTDWTNTLSQSDIDPKEYRNEFSRKSTEVASEISKGFRYADSLDAFSIWRTEQDVPLLGDTLKQQLVAMQDRFGATMQKDLSVLMSNPAYLATAIRNIDDAEGVVGKAKAEEFRQNARKISDSAYAKQYAQRYGSAKLNETLQDSSILTSLNPDERKKAVADAIFDENVQQQVLVQEDKKLEGYYEQGLLEANGDPKKLQSLISELGSTKRFHDGDTSYQWLQRLRGEFPRPSGADDWDTKPPDPLVLNNYFTLLGALNNPGTRAPNEPWAGKLAGQRVTPPGLATWMVDSQEDLGKVYRPEREKLTTWKSDAFTQSMQNLRDLRSSDTFKKRFGNDEAKFLQALGDRETQLRTEFQGRNPTEKELADSNTAWVTGLPTKAPTEDTPTDAPLNLLLWNDRYSNFSWKDNKVVRQQVDQVAAAQRSNLAKYLGRDLSTLRELAAAPAAGQEGYLMGKNGTELFYLKDKDGQVRTYAYVPEKFEATKPAGQQYAGTLKLQTYEGGKWTNLPAPEVTPAPSGSLGVTSPDVIVGKDADYLRNRIKALRSQKVDAQKVIDYADQVLAGQRPQEDPAQWNWTKEAKQKEIAGFDVDIANLQRELDARGGPK